MTEGNVLTLQAKVLKYLSRVEGHTMVTIDDIEMDTDIVCTYTSLHTYLTCMSVGNQYTSRFEGSVTEQS